VRKQLQKSSIYIIDCRAIQKPYRLIMSTRTSRTEETLRVLNTTAPASTGICIDKSCPVEWRTLIEWRKSEMLNHPTANAINHQSDINARMREIVVDWLHYVRDKFSISSETLFLAVNILDRVLEKHTVSRRHLQLIASAALFIACKYEETSTPTLGDFVMISDSAFSKEQLLSAESLLLNRLQFECTMISPLKYRDLYLNRLGMNTLPSAYNLTTYLILTQLQKEGYFAPRASHICAAAVWLTRSSLNDRCQCEDTESSAVTKGEHGTCTKTDPTFTFGDEAPIDLKHLIAPMYNAWMFQYQNRKVTDSKISNGIGRIYGEDRYAAVALVYIPRPWFMASQEIAQYTAQPTT
jgi:transcription initiation factor TFIIIB Brf1 subunit/transcription initiation factor TFIIB